MLCPSQRGPRCSGCVDHSRHTMDTLSDSWIACPVPGCNRRPVEGHSRPSPAGLQEEASSPLPPSPSGTTWPVSDQAKGERAIIELTHAPSIEGYRKKGLRVHGGACRMHACMHARRPAQHAELTSKQAHTRHPKPLTDHPLNPSMPQAMPQAMPHPGHAPCSPHAVPSMQFWPCPAFSVSASVRLLFLMGGLCSSCSGLQKEGHNAP